MTPKLNNKAYFKKPLCISILSALMAGYFSYKYIYTDKLRDVISKISEITINFSLTFAVFSITALALLSFVQNKEWFTKVGETKYFANFLYHFVLSFRFAIIILLITIAIRLIEPSYNTYVCSIILSLLIFLTVFLVSWIWRCIDDLFSLFQNNST